jgi:small-conductance mechanosensitive channel
MSGRFAGVDLKEQRQLDVTRRMAKVKAKAQPWRAIFAAVLALASAVVSGGAWNLGQGYVSRHLPNAVAMPWQYKVVSYGAATAFVFFASGATLGLSTKARDVLLPRVGAAHAAMVRIAVTLIGAIITLIATLALFRLNVGQLVLGGTLLVAVLGIASQQTLANLFAGLVLLVSRPFGVGDYVRLQSGTLGGQYEGTVIEIGLTYVRVDTRDGLLSLPNSQVLNAVVGPVKSSRPEPFGDS